MSLTTRSGEYHAIRQFDLFIGEQAAEQIDQNQSWLNRASEIPKLLADVVPLHPVKQKPLKPPTALRPTSTGLDRALPAWAIDRIRDGLDNSDNRKHYGTLVAVCMSAQRRGWGETELAALVCDPYQSKLWVQLSRNRNGKPYPATNMAKTYAKAWSDAETYLLDPDNSYDMKQRALELAFTWTDLLNDSGLETGLTEPEIAVLRYVIAETERRQWEKVACPSRAVESATGYGRQRIRTAFAKLTERGVLTQYEQGRRGTAAGKAAIYGLNLEPDPEPAAELTHINPKRLCGLEESVMWVSHATGIDPERRTNNSTDQRAPVRRYGATG